MVVGVFEWNAKGGRVRLQKLLRVMPLIATSVLWLGVDVSSSAGFSYPGYVASYYMDTVSTGTLYDMGCALGTARAGGSAPQDAIVVLDWGEAQLRSGVYGTWDYSSHYRTVTQIDAAVVAYAHGFYVCTGTNTSAHVRVGIGTNNYANFCKNCGMTDAEVTGHGKAWADMVDATANNISYYGYASQVDVVGAADIEVSWGTSSIGRRWVDAYDSVNNWPMYDFGDAAGCPQSGATATAHQCGTSSWYQDDLYWISWGSPSAWGLPEIYTSNNSMAKEWQQISKWATLNSKSKIYFAGAMTTTTGNSPSTGWTQLRDQCAADPATNLSTASNSQRKSSSTDEATYDATFGPVRSHRRSCACARRKRCWTHCGCERAPRSASGRQAGAR